VTVCGFDPAGQRLLTLHGDDFDQSLRIWDIESETPLILEAGDLRTNRALFSPRGGRVLRVNTHHGVCVWDVEAQVPHVLLEVPNHVPGHRLEAIFSPDGSRILVAFGNGGAGLWDVDTKAKLHSLDSEGQGEAGLLAFRADGQQMLVGRVPLRTEVWDASSGRLVCELNGDWGSTSFSAEGARILSWGDGAARLWEAETGKVLAVFAGHEASPMGAYFSRSGSTVITASPDGTVREWNLESEGQRTTHSTGSGLHRPFPVRPSLDPAGKRIAIATSTPDLQWVQVIDLDSPARPHGFQVPGTEVIRSLAFAPDGRSLVTAATNQFSRPPPEDSACTWDAETGARLVGFQHPADVLVYDAGFSPDGRLVVTAGDDGKARIWDARTGDLVRELVGHTGGVRSAAFGLGGRRVITSSEALVDRSVRIWDAETAAQLAILRTDGDQPTHACLSPDGRRALAGCWYGTVLLWDISSGEARRWPAHPSHLNSVAFSPDGTQILTASGNPGARLWDAETLDEILTLDAPEGVSASFSADGRWIVTASTNGTARIWPAQPLERARELAPRALTSTEREHYGLAPREKP
jgi:WD40 repeat protein